VLDRHATSGIPAAAHHRMLASRAPGRSGRARGLPRRRVRARLGVLACAATLLLAAPAAATWSLVAVDPVQREVGVAIASCIGGVERTLGVVPGRGVVVAQAWTSFRGRDRAVALLGQGVSPADVLAEIANVDFDRWSLSLFALRQYGVAALDGAGGGARAFTGASTTEWKGDLQGDGVSVQGNMLRGAEVVSRALAAFETAAALGLPLAERLLLGLEAGAAAGGDWRCSRAQAALSAVLLVARPGDAAAAPWLFLSSPGEPAGVSTILAQQLTQFWKRRGEGFADAPLAPGETRPVHDLRRRYEAWRRASVEAPPGQGSR
jgi:uncharacterized Ntn-hydrolase superfamily protein